MYTYVKPYNGEHLVFCRCDYCGDDHMAPPGTTCRICKKGTMCRK